MNFIDNSQKLTYFYYHYYRLLLPKRYNPMNAANLLLPETRNCLPI